MRPIVTACLPVLLLLGACDETDLVSVRVRLREDLSGSVRSSALQESGAGGAVEAASLGVVWDSRAEVVCAAGRFAELSDLSLADARFEAGAGAGGLHFVRVVLPRGEGARWPAAFVPLAKDRREAVAQALDPERKASEVGEALKIEIELPGSVVSHGLTGKVRGAKSSAEGELATLIVPVDAGRTEGEPFVWHLTWQQ